MPVGVKMTERDRRRFLEEVRNQHHPMIAAELVGFSWGTVKEALAEDHEFRVALDEAQEYQVAKVEDQLFDEAGHGAAWAIKMILTNRGPKGRWMDERSRAAAQLPSGDGGLSTQVVMGAMREVLADGSTRESALAILSSVPLPGMDVAPAEMLAGDDTPG